jgi:hypothetical protein
MPKLPDVLYRYRAINKFSIRELAENSFYFASPASFNDPFESQNIEKFDQLPDHEIQAFIKKYLNVTLSGWSQQDKDSWLDYLVPPGHGMLRRLEEFENYVRARLEGFAVLCLSMRNDDILMWSHYADSHKGMCLIFNTQAINISYSCYPIIYKTKYPKFMACIDARKRKLTLNNMLLTKSKHWKYECEVRLLVDPESVLVDTHPRLFQLPNGALTGVIFGCKTSTEDKTIIKDVLKRNNKKMDFYTARKSATDFSLFLYKESKILAWEQLSELPGGMSIPYGALRHVSSMHPPDEVTERYRQMRSPGDVVVWVTGEYCGIKVEDYNLVWRPEQVLDSTVMVVRSDRNFYKVVLTYRGKRQTLFEVWEFEEGGHQRWRELGNGLRGFLVVLENLLKVTAVFEVLDEMQ